MIVIQNETDVSKDILDFARREYVEMDWTTTPPTVEGWYWVYIEDPKAIENPAVVQVERENQKPDDKLGVWHSGNWDEFESVDEYSSIFSCHWLGPIPVPEPPKEGMNE